eukprot:463538-Rhodomonas_salina.2
MALDACGSRPAGAFLHAAAHEHPTAFEVAAVPVATRSPSSFRARPERRQRQVCAAVVAQLTGGVVETPLLASGLRVAEPASTRVNSVS